MIIIIKRINLMPGVVFLEQKQKYKLYDYIKEPDII